MPTAAHPKPSHLPPAILIPIGGALVLAVLAALFGHLHHATVIPATGVVVAQRDLRFTDRPDGGIDVTDAATGALVRTVTGQAGFIRGTMRGLASARRRAGEGPQAPFRLTEWQDGRLTLDDPDTHRHVELEAFGPVNAADFESLLPHHSPGTPP